MNNKEDYNQALQAAVNKQLEKSVAGMSKTEFQLKCKALTERQKQTAEKYLVRAKKLLKEERQ